MGLSHFAICFTVRTGLICSTHAKMKHVAAYLLAVQGGNESPSAADVKAILKAVDVDADDEALNVLIKEMEGKSAADVIAAGNAKLASVPSGGAAPAAGGAA